MLATFQAVGAKFCFNPAGRSPRRGTMSYRRRPCASAATSRPGDSSGGGPAWWSVGAASRPDARTPSSSTSDRRTRSRASAHAHAECACHLGELRQHLPLAVVAGEDGLAESVCHLVGEVVRDVAVDLEWQRPPFPRTCFYRLVHYWLYVAPAFQNLLSY